MNEAEERRQQAGGWVVYDGDQAVGAGPSMHAAIGDTRRRTGCPEHSGHRLKPATHDEWRRTAAKLGPRGLNAAEAAWCSGTSNSIPVYRRSVDAASAVLAASERLGGRLDGLTVRFDDGSKLELVALRGDVGGGRLVRLPPEEGPDAER